MEATKQDVIDVYPEYNGTGLIFLGQAQPATARHPRQQCKSCLSRWDWNDRQVWFLQ